MVGYVNKLQVVFSCILKRLSFLYSSWYLKLKTCIRKISIKKMFRFFSLLFFYNTKERIEIAAFATNKYTRNGKYSPFPSSLIMFRAMNFQQSILFSLIFLPCANKQLNLSSLP